MYHSTAVLLPDGRVLSAGQDEGDSGHFGEIYEPAYLFRGARPEISAVPARVAYSRPFSLGTTQAGDIGSVALVAPATVTHSLNTSQRYVGLDFEAIGEGRFKSSVRPTAITRRPATTCCSSSTTSPSSGSS